MKFRNRRLSAFAAVALVAGLALSACGSDNSNDSSGGSGGGGGGDIKGTFTFLPKNLGNPYLDTSDNAGKAAIESWGGKYQQVGPDTASPDAQYAPGSADRQDRYPEAPHRVPGPPLPGLLAPPHRKRLARRAGPDPRWLQAA